MQFSQNKDHSIARYESVNEIMDCGHQPANGKARNGRESQSGDKSFTGTESYASAEFLARNGWTEVRPDVLDQVGKIDASLRTIVQTTRTRRRSVAGGTVSIPRHLDGAPDSMFQVKRVPMATHGRVVTVLYNCSASAVVDQKTIIRRGVAILALCELLRIAGYSAEIWAEECVESRDGKGHHSTLTRILPAGTPIDIDNLMFPIAHPSFLRRAVFASNETQPAEIVNKFGFFPSGGYGAPRPAKCAEMVGADVVIDNPLRHGNPETEDPAKWVRDQLVNLGIID